MLRVRKAFATAGLTVAALLAAAPVAHAQSTQQLIDSAKALYEQFNVEAARPILLRIISPGYLQQVTSEQKAAAFKYLGASYAVLASPDSAKQFFTAALDFDPFTDLDPTKFAASELNAFNEAKVLLFKIGIRPVASPFLIIPTSQSDTAAYTFRLITTQRANLKVDIVSGDTVIQTLNDGISDGLKPIQWRGVLNNGKFIPPAVYQLRATGRSGSQNLTEAISFRIEHVFEPLEDSLPALDTLRRCQAGCDLLPERIPTIAPWTDLIKGSVLGIAALGLPLAITQKLTDPNAKYNWQIHAAAASGAGLIGGTISWWYRRSHPQIPQNVAENLRRRAVRDRFNAAVRQRNNNRLAATMLIIQPISSSIATR